MTVLVAASGTQMIYIRYFPGILANLIDFAVYKPPVIILLSLSLYPAFGMVYRKICYIVTL
jgi:hypothetical protein